MSRTCFRSSSIDVCAFRESCHVPFCDDIDNSSGDVCIVHSPVVLHYLYFLHIYSFQTFEVRRQFFARQSPSRLPYRRSHSRHSYFPRRCYDYARSELHNVHRRFIVSTLGICLMSRMVLPCSFLMTGW